MFMRKSHFCCFK